MESSSRYNFSLTTFSPSGKLVQIEYALNAVLGGNTSIGIKCREGIVLAAEKKPGSSLVDLDTVEKIYRINDDLGLVYSGIGPDAKVLVDKARKYVQGYWQIYMESPSVLGLVKHLADIAQEFTQSGGVRPFGVSLLVVGYDRKEHFMYQIEPSGSYLSWKASAIGKNGVSAKEFLEKRYHDDMSLEDAIHTAILALKEGYESVMTEDVLEVAVLSKVHPEKSAFARIPENQGLSLIPEFRFLTRKEISEYLENL